jgi:23S rRNA (guanosine2251-2'-O)-methyltransferase
MKRHKQVRNQKADKQVVDIVYGVHPIEELLKAKRRKVYEIYTLKTEPKIFNRIASLLPKYKIPVHHLTKELLTKKLGTSDHQGIAAAVAPFPVRKKIFDPKREPFLLLLDGVQDVRNFGAIVRSAYCTGVDGIIVCTKRGAPLSGAALKASAGLAERMEIYEASSVVVALQELKKAGYTIYVTALGGKQDATKLEYKTPLCVVIGSEGKGVSRESLKAGTLVTLPQKSEDISYNASVAAGIILFLISQK